MFEREVTWPHMAWSDIAVTLNYLQGYWWIFSLCILYYNHPLNVKGNIFCLAETHNFGLKNGYLWPWPVFKVSDEYSFVNSCKNAQAYLSLPPSLTHPPSLLPSLPHALTHSLTSLIYLKIWRKNLQWFEHYWVILLGELSWPYQNCFIYSDSDSDSDIYLFDHKITNI